jgi:hypothetical protein
MPSFSWSPIEGSGGGGSGVDSVNGLSGALTLAAGTGITLTTVGNTITIDATGGGGGATTALDNLASTAVNAPINSPSTLQLGSSDTDGSSLYLGNSFVDLYGGANGDGFISVYGNTLDLVNDSGAAAPILRFNDAAASNTISIKASDAGVTTYGLVLPLAQGGAGEVLTNDGSGNLSWAQASATGILDYGRATSDTGTITNATWSPIPNISMSGTLSPNIGAEFDYTNPSGVTRVYLVGFTLLFAIGSWANGDFVAPAVWVNGAITSQGAQVVFATAVTGEVGVIMAPTIVVVPPGETIDCKVYMSRAAGNLAVNGGGGGIYTYMDIVQIA